MMEEMEEMKENFYIKCKLAFSLFHYSLFHKITAWAHRLTHWQDSLKIVNT